MKTTSKDGQLVDGSERKGRPSSNENDKVGNSANDVVMEDVDGSTEAAADTQGSGKAGDAGQSSKTSAAEQNRKFRNCEPELPVSPDSAEQRREGNIAPGTTPKPRWCPAGLTHTQRRRLQRLRTLKLREEQAEKERDEFFNTMRPMQPARKEWRVKRSSTPPALIASDEVDLLDEGSPLIRSGTPPPESMDINMVFTLPAEFKSVEKDMARLCLGPKDAVFEKPEDSSRHLKPLYVREHIDGHPISRMLVDGGAAVNLMPYSVFKKLGKVDSELMKTNLTLNGVGGDPMEAKGVISMQLTVGSKALATAFFVVEVQGNYSVILGRDWIHANRCVASTLH